VVRKRVVFIGRVQGVGFRHATKMQSRAYEVYGYVRNNKDGSVELVLEGDREEVKAFILSVQQRMNGVIEQTNTTCGIPSGEFTEFSVLY